MNEVQVRNQLMAAPKALRRYVENLERQLEDQTTRIGEMVHGDVVSPFWYDYLADQRRMYLPRLCSLHAFDERQRLRIDTSLLRTREVLQIMSVYGRLHVLPSAANVVNIEAADL